MNFVYNQPVKIIFGIDSVKNIKDIIKNLGYNNGLLVCDPFLAQNGLADKLISFSEGLISGVFHDLVPNPTTDNVDHCCNEIRKNKYDFLVALGGGSSIDCAKASSVMSCKNHRASDYLLGKQPIPKSSLPIIAIPTTAGTGSEVTGVSVLTDPENSIKAPIGSELFFPKIAIIDPVLTLSLPQRVTASCGLDVLCHAIEGYWSRNHQPVCDSVAITAAEIVFEYLMKAYNEPGSLTAREKMCEASVLAGLAFALPKTTACHACSFPLTNLYKIPHGEACALTLDAMIRINAQDENSRLDYFSHKIGFKSPYEMADKVYELKLHTGMRTGLKEAGITETELPMLAELSQHPNMLNNPVKMDKEKTLAMYCSLL